MTDNQNDKRSSKNVTTRRSFIAGASAGIIGLSLHSLRAVNSEAYPGSLANLPTGLDTRVDCQIYSESNYVLGTKVMGHTQAFGNFEIGLQVPPRVTIDAKVSPDNRWIAFVCESNLYVARLTTSPSRPTTFGCGARRTGVGTWERATLVKTGVGTGIAWVNGWHILAVHQRFSTGVRSGLGDIIMIEAIKGNWANTLTSTLVPTATDGGPFKQPVVSPDARRILFWSPGNGGLIHSVGIDGRDLVCENPGGCTLPGGSWNPGVWASNDKVLASRLNTSEIAGGMYVFNRGGGGLRYFAGTDGYSGNPVKSVDGRKFGYSEPYMRLDGPIKRVVRSMDGSDGETIVTDLTTRNNELFLQWILL